MLQRLVLPVLATIGLAALETMAMGAAQSAQKENLMPSESKSKLRYLDGRGGLIEMFEDLLCRAKKGEVEAAMVAWLTPIGSCYAWSNKPGASFVRAIGAVETLKTRLMLDYLEVEHDQGDAIDEEGPEDAH